MFLRQSTSQVVRFGPCLDKTNGVTEETSLTLAQGDMRLSKDGAAFAQKMHLATPRTTVTAGTTQRSTPQTPIPAVN